MLNETIIIQTLPTDSKVSHHDASEARKRVLEDELRRYLDLLITHERPDRVIIFGSLVSGDVHPWSDIDLVIIKKTDKTFWQRLRRVRRLLKPRVGTDILYYTPEEFDTMGRERPFVRQEIVEKGIVVYERGR